MCVGRCCVSGLDNWGKRTIMAKTRKRTKAHKASDAAFSGLMAVVMAVGAALVFLFIILSNVFSLSTMADFGVRQYVDNVTSLHMSQTFQTVRPMLAYENIFIPHCTLNIKIQDSFYFHRKQQYKK